MLYPTRIDNNPKIQAAIEYKIAEFVNSNPSYENNVTELFHCAINKPIAARIPIEEVNNTKIGFLVKATKSEIKPLKKMTIRASILLNDCI